MVSVNQVQELSTAALGYYKVVKENQKLYNMVQDLKGCYFSQTKVLAMLSYFKSTTKNCYLILVETASGNIRVYCRIRPSFSYESGNVISFIGEDGSLVISDPAKPQKDGRKVFQFNQVFGPTARQGSIRSKLFFF